MYLLAIILGEFEFEVTWLPWAEGNCAGLDISAIGVAGAAAGLVL